MLENFSNIFLKLLTRLEDVTDVHVVGIITERTVRLDIQRRCQLTTIALVTTLLILVTSL